MTREEAEQIYVTNYKRALKLVCRTLRASMDIAEDAVQRAGLELIENAEKYHAKTPALFLRRSKDRAVDIIRSEAKRVENREHSVGDTYDLAGIEGREVRNRIGRAPGPETACE